jgi:hypothetical protein
VGELMANWQNDEAYFEKKHIYSSETKYKE